jgi:hypothetical protein
MQTETQEDHFQGEGGQIQEKGRVSRWIGCGQRVQERRSSLRAVADKWGTLLIHNGATAEEAAARAEEGLEDPDKRENGEAKRGPVDEPVFMLVHPPC